MSLNEIRQDLLQTKVSRLDVETGVVYRDAVHFCLSETMNSSEDLNRNVLDIFARNVIESLKDLAETYI
jgi:hypothetical protein